jgi:hypothetical protein
MNISMGTFIAIACQGEVGTGIENTVPVSHDYEGITPNVGDEATLTPGTWSGSPVLTYQWRRSGVDIGGETGLTYTFVDADFGLTVDVIEIPDGVTASAVASAATGAVTGGLNQDLIAYWKLGEASGNREDSVGSHDLVPTNTPGNAAGKLGDALALVGASTQYAGVADHADLRGGDRDWAFDGWLYLTDPTVVQEVLSKGSALTTANFEYRVFVSAGNNLSLRTSNGTGVVTVSQNGLAANTWHYFLVFHDSASNTIGISLDNAVPTTAAFTASGAHVLAQPLRVGVSPAITLPMTGRVDELARWNRLLTSTERGQRYNSGSGITHPF